MERAIEPVFWRYARRHIDANTLPTRISFFALINIAYLRTILRDQRDKQTAQVAEQVAMALHVVNTSKNKVWNRKTIAATFPGVPVDEVVLAAALAVAHLMMPDFDRDHDVAAIVAAPAPSKKTRRRGGKDGRRR